jgi:MYXO-CTERM domain-containing protein
MKFNGLALSAAAIGLSVLGWAGSARAACVNDNDCPNAACGGEVCTYSNTGATMCNPAGTGPAGQDGWCTTDANCKCMGLGAHCSGVYCTFTLPPDAGTTASSGAGSTSGTGATSGGTVSSGAGASGTSASGTSESGTATAPETSSSKSGCSMSGPAGTSTPWAFGVVALGACLALSRRRRS